MTEIDPSVILKDGDCIYFRGVKYQRVEKPKPTTLYDVIYEWYHEDATIDYLITKIEEWLPKEQSAAGSQNVYVECTVEGFNDCLTKIKGMLR